MLEKEVVKFTRDGMQKQNLSSGEKELITTSEWGMQLHYKNCTGQYQKTDTHYRHQPAGRDAQSAGTLKYQRKADVRYQRGGENVSVHNVLDRRLTEGRISRIRQSILNHVAPRMEQSNTGSDPAEEGARQTASSAGEFSSWIFRRATRKRREVQKRQREAEQQMVRQNQARQATIQMQQAARDVAAKKAAVTAGSTATAASGGTAVLVVLGVVAVVILLLLLTIVVSIVAVDQPSDDLSAYVLMLDNEFLDETNQAGRQAGKEHRVDGAYLVHTNAGDIQMLLNVKGRGEELTDDVKAEVKKYHRMLNTYTVSDGTISVTPPVTEANPEPLPEERPAVIVTIKTFTLQEKMEELGLSGEERDALSNLLVISAQTGGENVYGGGWTVSEKVLQYDSLIQKYAQQYGIPDFIPVIRAIMMQESGGTGTDPMGSSGSTYNVRFPHEPGGITEPEYSIDCGIHDLSDCLKLSGCNALDQSAQLSLAIQAYDFGQEYIPWARQHYGGHSETGAAAYAEAMRVQSGMVFDGDVYYVQHVMRYLSVSGASVAGTGRFLWPVPGYTKLSSYWGDGRNHQGIDIASSGIYGKPIVAAESGTVTAAVCVDDNSGYGLHVDIQHSDGFMTRYGHCSRVIVSAGQYVSKGQVIAYVGDSGRSTGPHLHFEIRENGIAVDPLNYFDRNGVSPE